MVNVKFPIAPLVPITFNKKKQHFGPFTKLMSLVFAKEHRPAFVDKKLSQRSRAMLSVSLVSFSSTVPRVQSFIISYCSFRLRTTKFCSVLLSSATLKLLVINISLSVSREQQTMPRSVSPTCHGPVKLCL